MSNKYEPTMHPHPVKKNKGGMPADRRWPQEHDDALKTMTALEGRDYLSFGGIADALTIAFGNHPDARLRKRFSRSAVISRSRRLGLRLPAPVKDLTTAERKARGWLTGAEARAAKKRRVQPSMPMLGSDLPETGDADADALLSGRREAQPLGRMKRARNPAEYAKAKLGNVPALHDCGVHEHAKAFLEAGYDECKWPLDDLGSKVCGARATIGSYCATHAQRVYRQLPTVRRNKLVRAGSHKQDLDITLAEIAIRREIDQ